MHQANKAGIKELIITVVILAILASIAVPSYINYARKKYYNELVQTTLSFKAGIAACYQKTADLMVCDGGSNYIPANITTATGAVASLIVKHGIITVTPVVSHGVVAADTYILTPTIVNNNITWTASGGGITAGYIK